MSAIHLGTGEVNPLSAAANCEVITNIPPPTAKTHKETRPGAQSECGNTGTFN